MGFPCYSVYAVLEVDWGNIPTYGGAWESRWAVGVSSVRLSREVTWSAIWLRELLSALGAYMLSTTQHMPRAIRLSSASRYLWPSSYLRHALLLGFSSSPHRTLTHSTMLVFIYLFISFCSRKSLDILQCCFFLYLSCNLFGRTVWQLIAHHYCLSCSHIHLWISVLSLVVPLPLSGLHSWSKIY